MHGRHEGHPFGATLVIAAIFSVALAFHLAQPPTPSIPARVEGPMVMYAGIVSAHPATLPLLPASRPHRLSRASSSSSLPATAIVPVAPLAMSEPMLETLISLPASTPALTAFSWSTQPSPYPPGISTVAMTAPQADRSADRGVVTHAFVSAGAAVRTALKKAF